MPKLGPWVEELERRLEAREGENKRDRLSLLRIFEALAELGYRGGYDAVRRYAMGWRRRRRAVSSSQVYVPLVFAPGEAYQFDWSHEQVVLAGKTARVKAAHLRLCHSRMFLVQLYPRESQEMVFDAHERAFRFFGGVCHRGIYDNLKTAVNTVFVGKEREYNERFLQMCSHHLVEPVACTPIGGHFYAPVDTGASDDRQARHRRHWTLESNTYMVGKYINRTRPDRKCRDRLPPVDPPHSPGSISKAVTPWRLQNFFTGFGMLYATRNACGSVCVSSSPARSARYFSA